MQQKQEVPQDIQKAAFDYEQARTAVYTNGVERKIAVDSYTQGRLDERTAHTVVSEEPKMSEELKIALAISNRSRAAIYEKYSEQPPKVVSDVDVEKLAKDKWTAATEYYRDIDKPDQPTPVRIQKAWMNGHNAAIQSQSVEAISSVKKDTGAEAMIRKLAEMKKDGTMPTENATPVQLQGSVREIAKREFEDFCKSENVDFVVESIEWQIWKRAYDSAARNLPVGNGWTDTDMKHAYIFGVQLDKSRIDIAWKKWLQQYKLTHSPVHSSDAVEEVRQMIQSEIDIVESPLMKDEDVLGWRRGLHLIQTKFNELFPPLQ